MFSERLKHYRIQSGMTQAQAAEKLRVTRVSYARYELGTNEPRLERLPSIARLFGCTIDDLFAEKNAATKASAQTLLPESEAPLPHADDTPPWEEAERDLDDVLE